jgi:hypothetical protein
LGFLAQFSLFIFWWADLNCITNWCPIKCTLFNCKKLSIERNTYLAIKYVVTLKCHSSLNFRACHFVSFFIRQTAAVSVINTCFQEWLLMASLFYVRMCAILHKECENSLVVAIHLQIFLQEFLSHFCHLQINVFFLGSFRRARCHKKGFYEVKMRAEQTSSESCVEINCFECSLRHA